MAISLSDPTANIIKIAGKYIKTGGTDGTIAIGGISPHNTPLPAINPVINPLLIGGYASTTTPNTVTSGNLAQFWTTLNGALNIADANGSLTVDQNNKGTAAGAWEVKLTNDGTNAVAIKNTALVATDYALGVGIHPSANSIKITDGTTTAGVITTIQSLKTDLSSIAGTSTTTLNGGTIGSLAIGGIKASGSLIGTTINPIMMGGADDTAGGSLIKNLAVTTNGHLKIHDGGNSITVDQNTTYPWITSGRTSLPTPIISVSVTSGSSLPLSTTYSFKLFGYDSNGDTTLLSADASASTTTDTTNRAIKISITSSPAGIESYILYWSTTSNNYSTSQYKILNSSNLVNDGTNLIYYFSAPTSDSTTAIPFPTVNTTYDSKNRSAIAITDLNNSVNNKASFTGLATDISEYAEITCNYSGGIFTIQFSNDKSTWVTYQTVAASASENTIVFPTIARYFRIVGTNTTTAITVYTRLWKVASGTISKSADSAFTKADIIDFSKSIIAGKKDNSATFDTNDATIKSASTAAAATDTALVTVLRDSIPTGSNVIGSIKITDGTTTAGVITGIQSVKSDLSSIAGISTLNGGTAGSLAIGGIKASGTLIGTTINPIMIGGADDTSSGSLIKNLAVTTDGHLKIHDGGNSITVDQDATTPWTTKIYDGTNSVVVKKTALTDTDYALGVGIHPSANSIKITDGTTTVSVIDTNNALKTDLSSIAGISTLNGGTDGSLAIGGIKASGTLIGTTINPIMMGGADDTAGGSLIKNLAVTIDGHLKIHDGGNSITIDQTGSSPWITKLSNNADGSNNVVIKNSVLAATDYALGVGIHPSANIIRISNDGTNYMPTAHTNATGLFVKLTDGTNNITIKASNTLPVTTDTAIVATLRDKLPAGNNIIGKVSQDATTPWTTKIYDGTNSVVVKKTALTDTDYALGVGIHPSANSIKITDGTTTAGVITGIQSVKSDLSSIAGISTLNGGTAGSLAIGGIKASGSLIGNINPIMMGGSDGTYIVNIATNNSGHIKIHDGDNSITVDQNTTYPWITSGRTSLPTPTISAVLISGGSLSPSTTYYFKLFGYDSNGDTTLLSNEPTGITATATNKTITISITSSPAGIESYILYWSTTSNNYSTSQYKILNSSNLVNDGTNLTYSFSIPTSDGTVATAIPFPTVNTTYDSKNRSAIAITDLNNSVNNKASFTGLATDISEYAEITCNYSGGIFTIQFSNDKSTWVTYQTVAASASGNTIVFPTIARYFRIVGTATDITVYTRLWKVASGTISKSADSKFTNLDIIGFNKSIIAGKKDNSATFDTNDATIKSASTAAAATDTALVTVLRDSIPTGSNVIGSIKLTNSTSSNTAEVLTNNALKSDLSSIAGISTLNGGTAGSLAIGGIKASGTLIGTTINPIMIGGADDTAGGSLIKNLAVTTDGHLKIHDGGNSITVDQNTTTAWIVQNAAPSNTKSNISTISTTTLTSGLVIKASAGNLFTLTGFNSSATNFYYIQLHDKITLVSGTTVPNAVFYVPPLSNFAFDYGVYGRSFSTGIYAVASSTVDKYTSTSNNDIWFDATYN